MDLGRHPDAWDGSTLYADDLAVGQVYPLGSHTVDQRELVEFATEWDPQFFHIDPDAAARGAFGGLIASGVHTLAVFQRLAVDGFWGRCATVAARGMRDVRFVRPLRAGTELKGRLVVDAIRHRDAQRSLVSVSGTLEEHSGPVLTVALDVYVARRGA